MYRMALPCVFGAGYLEQERDICGECRCAL